MTDKPIIFSAPMVRALLEGRKTQTRRVLKPQPGPWDALFSKDGKWWDGDAETGAVHSYWPVRHAVGDRLWVREAWRALSAVDELPPRDMSGRGHRHYEADGKPGAASAWGRFRQGMHMPRWASRITLHVTDVRVQQVQEISDDDAVAEGVEPVGSGAAFVQLKDAATYSTTRTCFQILWDSINAGRGYGWGANPWVAAYTFDVELCNIEQARAAA